MQRDYAQIQRSLAASHALADPAEAHGTLAGALCASGPYRLEDWLADILPEGVRRPTSIRRSRPSMRPRSTPCAAATWTSIC